MRFAGKVAYVTGGGHGIGRAIAHRLAGEGAKVTVADVDADAAAEAADSIGTSGGVAFASVCDVTKIQSVRDSFAQAMDQLGRLDILVNTAGGDWAEAERFEEIEDAVWIEKIDLNLLGTGRCIKVALPHLIASGRGSNIVSIGSINGMTALSGYPYSAAKAGLEIMTKNLAVRYGPHGIRVNLISPATIRTRNWDGREDDLQRIAPKYPLGRIGRPEDIAAAVAFLASDEAAWISGINLPVDGGYLAGSIGP